MYTILGAGLSGLSVADHLKQSGRPFEIYEGKAYGGGHTHSEVVDGLTWDEGPHISFTKSDYVQQYFASNCNNDYLEFAVSPVNYYRGSWIPHPAQSNLYAIPQPLRAACVRDLIIARARRPAGFVPGNYREWMQHAFGASFSTHLSEVYTLKYWTMDAGNLTTDWIGPRVYFPDLKQAVESAQGPPATQPHYINRFRYPAKGGFYSYIRQVEGSLPLQYNKQVASIAFHKKQVSFLDGQSILYERLISTIPLPDMIAKSDAPEEIKHEAEKLKCSQVLIVNIVVNHEAVVEHQWLYVYDPEMYATRINFTEKLSPNNGLKGKCGIQVEVYFSRFRPLKEPVPDVERKVVEELLQMGLIKDRQAVTHYHSKWVKWANVIFDDEREAAQENIFKWLATVGMEREEDDLLPMTDWQQKLESRRPLGDVILAGRYAQWKYFWTDDCVLRALFITMNTGS